MSQIKYTTLGVWLFNILKNENKKLKEIAHKVKDYTNGQLKLFSYNINPFYSHIYSRHLNLIPLLHPTNYPFIL